MKRNSSVVWLAWEQHRRSRELASCLGAELHTFDSALPYLPRVIWLGLKTVGLLSVVRPSLLVVQNPSIVLAALASALRPVYRYTLVVDRHSNFKQGCTSSKSPKWRLFHWLSRYSLRNADLTIVTNEEASALVAKAGGAAYVLPDKIPEIASARAPRARTYPTAVFVCSYADDEPIDAVLEAASLMPEVQVFLTGRAPANVRATATRITNVTLTGFLPEEDYRLLLAEADVVAALTTAEATLLCAAYEAVAVGAPLVLSPRKVLLQLFSKGRVVSEHSPSAIASAVREALNRRQELRSEVEQLRAEMNDAWDIKWRELLAVLERLRGPDSVSD